MAAKNQSFPTYQPLPREDQCDAALLRPEDRGNDEIEPKPNVTITFSPVQVIRVLILPFIITDCVLMLVVNRNPGLAGFFASWAILILIWNFSRIATGLFGGMGNQKFDLNIGTFFCSFGASSLGYSGPLRRRSYLVNMVDCACSLLFIILSVVALHSDVWLWCNEDALCGINITLALLQMAVAFLGLFSMGRKVKIAMYKMDEDSKTTYTTAELFRDEISEPRDSMSSEV
ncbi:hypothetical protein FZEAL_6998 [Fusarium zealandicum]|uniref:Uncharacterized protein n=1 Tax=Fusarium zealandicum TaxID=1053134 RepID=A0A8H4XIW8_9HYPO|nr:hypothetical protein FZEAL_6998 [Fusarium zealandicum]